METRVVDSVIACVGAACDHILSSPYRHGSEIVFPSEGEILIAGDLHGDGAAFDEILRRADLEHNRFRHLLLQELIHGQDDAGGGNGSAFLTEKAAALVCRFPARVHIIMGNHEMAELTGRVVLKEGVILNEALKHSMDARYGERAGEVLEAFRRLWRSLPLAARTCNRVFISHSTPSRKHIDRFDPSVLRRPMEDADLSRDTGSAYALLWGRDFSPDIAERLLEMLDADFLVSGHTPCEEGYKAPNGKHVIIDSQGPNGKYLLLPLTGSLTYDEIVSKISPIWS